METSELPEGITQEDVEQAEKELRRRAELRKTWGMTDTERERAAWYDRNAAAWGLVKIAKERQG